MTDLRWVAASPQTAFLRHVHVKSMCNLARYSNISCTVPFSTCCSGTTSNITTNPGASCMGMGHEILPKVIPINFAPLLQKRSLIYNSRRGVGFQHVQQKVGQVHWTKVIGCQSELQASAENVHIHGTLVIDVCDCPTVPHMQTQCGRQEMEPI